VPHVPLCLNKGHGEEEDKEIPGDDGGEGGVTRGAGDASGGEARGREEASRSQGEAQAESGQAAGGGRSPLGRRGAWYQDSDEELLLTAPMNFPAM
jgi:hypothetical protein